MTAKGSLPQRELRQLFGVKEDKPLSYARDRISEIRRNSEVGTIVMVGQDTVHDLLGDIRFLLNVLDQVRAERDSYREEAMNERKLSADIVGEREQLYLEIEAKDKVLVSIAHAKAYTDRHWYRDQARIILDQYAKGEDTK